MSELLPPKDAPGEVLWAAIHQLHAKAYRSDGEAWTVIAARMLVEKNEARANVKQTLSPEDMAAAVADAICMHDCGVIVADLPPDEREQWGGYARAAIAAMGATCAPEPPK